MNGQESGSESDIRVDKNLVFATPNGHALVLDLYRPESQEGAPPVVVWIFGDAFRIYNRVAQQHAATWLTQHGFAVAVISYRLSGEAHFPAQVHDSRAHRRVSMRLSVNNFHHDKLPYFIQ